MEFNDEERRRHDKAWNDPPHFSFDELNKAPKSAVPLSKRYKYPVPEQQPTLNQNYDLPMQQYQNQGNYPYNQQYLPSSTNSNQQYQQNMNQMNYNYLSQGQAPGQLATQMPSNRTNFIPQPQYFQDLANSQPNLAYNSSANYNTNQQSPCYINSMNSAPQFQNFQTNLPPNAANTTSVYTASPTMTQTNLVNYEQPKINAYQAQYQQPQSH